MSLILAESVSIDGGVIAILLAVLFLLVAAAIATMVAGVVWAKRAARGSTPALGGFIAVATTELLLTMVGLANSGRFIATVSGIAFFGHVGLYAYERTKVSGGGPSDEDAPPTP